MDNLPRLIDRLEQNQVLNKEDFIRLIEKHTPDTDEYLFQITVKTTASTAASGEATVTPRDIVWNRRTLWNAAGQATSWAFAPSFCRAERTAGTPMKRSARS